MKLKSIELTNYRRFKNALIEFPEGVIGILGLNGVGKSTIIEAIAWALYGNQPTIVRTTKEDLKRYGAAQADECAVKLEFELAGDKYLITRRMTGKNFQTLAEVSVNGRAEATSTKGVTALIEQRLGMDYQAFYTSVFAKQKELNALSDIEPSKRKSLIIRMLNIDSIDKAIKSVNTDKKELKTRLNENRSILVDQDGAPKIETCGTQIKVLEDDAKNIKGKIKDLEKQKMKLLDGVKSLEQKRTEQRKLRVEFNKIKTELTKAQTNLKNLVSQHERIENDLKSLDTQEQELAKLLPKKDEWVQIKKKKGELEVEQKKFIRLKELKEQLMGVTEQIKKHEKILTDGSKKTKDFKHLGKEFKEFQVAKVNLEDEIEKIKRLRSEYNAKSEQLNIEVAKLKDKLKEIHELGPESECPTCERLLEEHYQYLENKFNNEISEMASEIKEMEKSDKDLEKKLNDAHKRFEALKKREKFLNQQSEERARLESTIKASENELKHHETKQKDLNSSLDEIKDVRFDEAEFKQISTKYQELEKVNEKIIALTGQVGMIPKLKTELKGINEKQNTISSSISGLEQELAHQGFNEDVLVQLETKYDEEVEKLKDQELELKDEQNKLGLNAEKIEQLTSKIKELRELEEKIKVYEEKLMYLVKLDLILNKFKNYMIGRIAPTLTLYASDLFRELTDGKYNRLEIDQDYNVMLYDDGTPFSLQRFSGGEEDLANLCLRLAISQVITAQANTSNLNLIILDEIFGSQDLHRKRNLLQALNGLTNKFRQIFLITHIEDVKDYITYNIQVSENADGTSSTNLIS